MTAGVCFDGEHCFDNMGIILAQKEIGLPEVQTSYIQVPGREGEIDLTESATGEVRFYNREIVLTFVTCKNVSKNDWPLLITKVAAAIHGNKKQIIFDDDKNYYYLGRCSIDTFETTHAKQTIVVDCICDPYKYSIYTSDSPWLWDPFSFVNGIAKSEGQVDVTSTTTWTEVTLAGDQYNTTLEIICSNAMTMQYDGVEYSLSAGTNTMYDVKLQNGENLLYFKGNGTVTLVTRGGRF